MAEEQSNAAGEQDDKGMALKSALLWLAIIAGAAWFYVSADPEEAYYQGVVLRSDVGYVSTRRWKPSGLQWLATGAGGIVFTSAPAGAANHGRNVVVLVHGFGAPQSELTRYFEGLIGYLREDARIDAPIVVYDWPSVEPLLDAAQSRAESRQAASRIAALIPASNPSGRQAAWTQARYLIDLEHARTPGAEGLAELLRALDRDQPASISIVAHSMGSYVVAESLKHDPPAFAGVQRIVLLAPDLPSSLFGDADFRAVSTRIGGLHIFFSRNDRALSLLSRAANWQTRLGSDGPDAASQLPANVVVRDVTDTLGAGLEVHARYLTREGAALLDLAGTLKDPGPKQH